MVSHVSLIVDMITVKNNSSSLHGLAKYKISNESSQMIKFKYFLSANQSPRMFTTGDTVFISGKYVIENSEPCFTIAYSSIIGNKNPNHEFNTTALPVCIPHCMYSVIVSREAKEVSEFVHFGAETIEYNSITGKPDVKMDFTIIYPSKSPRFKYLGPSGSNIKLRSTYFISGLFRFSKTGKMMIEATDIDYLRNSNISITTPESSLSTTDTPSIIDIIDDDVDSIMQPKQPLESSLPPAKDININTSVTHDIDQLPDSDIHDQEVVGLDDDINLQDEADDFEEIQPNKKRKSTSAKLNEKGKKAEKK